MMFEDMREHFKKYNIAEGTSVALFLEARRGLNETTWEIAGLWADSLRFRPNLIDIDSTFELLCFYSLLGETEDTTQRALITARRLSNLLAETGRIKEDLSKLALPRWLRNVELTQND